MTMTDSTIILCPGQGAQRVGMGRAWFEASPRAAEVFAAADDILADAFEAPLSKLCFAGDAETINRTDVAQPALYTVAVASYHAWIGDGEPTLAATAGLSLGEYTALHIAGALSFADGLRLVALRGQAMQEAALAVDSSMVALIGADASQAAQVCETVTREHSDLILVPANYNAPGQVVLSGHSQACDLAVEAAMEAGLRAKKLDVAGAFHSPLMAPAAARLSAALDSVELSEPICPVLSNVTGRPHGEIAPDQPLSDQIKAGLVAQLTSPVRWDSCCQWLAQSTCGAYHELAPGKVLAGLARRIDRSIKVTTHDTPD